MPPPRVGQRATAHAPKPERIISRMTVKLRRVRQYGGAEPGRTLMFTFEGGTRRAERSLNSFIDKDRVPEFEGEEAWFEVEEVSGKPWAFWRAVRRVEPPGDA
ncbi:hypothetical protein [Caulobacter sp. FWC26]|uniref:hypothetical protein n=1 Tax=Caulobacter sp. FWC26 TaxID=69665 RepID=UPI000C3D0D20|nr:hypothetical protein [Caulobacter sp. FWC26]